MRVCEWRCQPFARLFSRLTILTGPKSRKHHIRQWSKYLATELIFFSSDFFSREPTDGLTAITASRLRWEWILKRTLYRGLYRSSIIDHRTSLWLTMQIKSGQDRGSFEVYKWLWGSTTPGRFLRLLHPIQFSDPITVSVYASYTPTI